MDEEREFCRNLEAARQGDQAAISQLVSQFQPEIKRFVHFRLSDPKIRRIMDSLDICQSVLMKFFVDLSAGSIAIEDPTALKHFLLTMAKNRMTDHFRKHGAQRRNTGRQLNVDSAIMNAIPDVHSQPGDTLAQREIAELLRTELSEKERYVFDARMSGKKWKDLAVEFDVEPDTLRQQMNRAADRVARLLGTHRRDL